MKANNVDLINKTILITGSAGFIGANLAQELLKTVESVNIIGIDNMNDYYDVNLKEYRCKKIEEESTKHSKCTWRFIRGSIADKELVSDIFEQYQPDVVVNLAAQAGVRYSITNPDAYIESNLVGFYNILESCRHSYDNNKKGVEHLVYASSSSVYGTNKKIPYSTDDKVDNPVSLYAATKKSNELIEARIRIGDLENEVSIGAKAILELESKLKSMQVELRGYQIGIIGKDKNDVAEPELDKDEESDKDVAESEKFDENKEVKYNTLLDTDVIQEEAGDIVEPENEAERVKDTKKKKKKKK